jgi:hypothetical protein
MSNPKKPKPGDLRIDASDVTVTDLSPAEVLRLNKLHDGHIRAVDELSALAPEQMERAGILPREIDHLRSLQKEDDHLGELLAAAEKLVELLTDTRLLRRHEIAAILSSIAAEVQRRAEQAEDGPELLAAFTRLLEYQFGPALKQRPVRVIINPVREPTQRRLIA